jgi:hypothetical protein
MYGSWIYNYLCNQCLSFHHLCCEFEFWFSPDTSDSATNKTYLHDITEILLKVAFNTMTIILTIFSFFRRLAILYFFINKIKYEIECNVIIDGDKINVPIESGVLQG